jgi:hypothetical protein
VVSGDSLGTDIPQIAVSQGADVASRINQERKRVIMGEGQRDEFVKKMVESSRKDPQLRATFLGTLLNNVIQFFGLSNECRFRLHWKWWPKSRRSLALASYLDGLAVQD